MVLCGSCVIITVLCEVYCVLLYGVFVLLLFVLCLFVVSRALLSGVCGVVMLRVLCVACVRVVLT